MGLVGHSCDDCRLLNRSAKNDAAGSALAESAEAQRSRGAGRPQQWERAWETTRAGGDAVAGRLRDGGGLMEEGVDARL